MSDKKKSPAKSKVIKAQQQLVDYFMYAAYEPVKAGNNAIEDNKCHAGGANELKSQQ